MGVVQDLSFIHFVFPFQFDAGTIEERVRAITDSKLESGNHQHPVWLPFHVEDDVLHPSFSRLLRIEGSGRDVAESAPAESGAGSRPATPRPAAYLWRLNS